MAQKKNRPRERQIGKKRVEKKPLIDPRYRSTIWTIVIIVILLIFFIENNTKSVPKHGPYPPSYNAAENPPPDTAIDPRLQMNTHINKK